MLLGILPFAFYDPANQRMTNSEAPGVQLAHFIHVLMNVQEVCAVLVVLEDRFLLIAAGGDKVDSDSVFKMKEGETWSENGREERSCQAAGS